MIGFGGMKNEKLKKKISQQLCIHLSDGELEHIVRLIKENEKSLAPGVDVTQTEPTSVEPIDRNYGNYNIQGIGPNAKTVVNEEGGRQSKTDYAADCVPPLAFARICKVLSEGRNKYGRHNWLHIPNTLEHINKAIMHVYAYLAGDRQENLDPSEHLAHSICRLMFALDLIEREKQNE